MLQFYRIERSFIDINTGKILLSSYDLQDGCFDSKPDNEHIELTWDNIERIDFGHMLHYPDITKHKKGIVLEFGRIWGDWYRYRQWLKEDLNIEYVIEYIPVQKSIKSILEYHNSDLAIQYLLERGINCLWT